MLAAQMLCENESLRMPIVGTSMLPSLHAPMMLQLGSARRVRVGDVIVFYNGETHVAHRVVALDASGFVTAGDAQPQVSERVHPGDVVGRVVAVWSNAGPRAFRVDRHRHRLRAAYFARAYRLRRFAAKLADFARRADPRTRIRATPQIVRAIRAACNGDADRLADALSTDAAAFFGADERHRTAAWLAERARTAAILERLPAEITGRLRRARLEAAMGAACMRPVLEATIAALHEAGLTFALLKGAARIYGGAPDAACHPADDIDVLLAPDDVERAAAALLARGWTYRDDPAEVERFRREQHHAASLFPPGGSFPVELHRALALPRALSTRTDWEAMAPFLESVEGPAGTVLRLDTAGTALHLGIHAIGLTRLRDIALLAPALRRMTEAERARLAGIVRAERRDQVRLDAAFALAARVAGVAWPSSERATAYIAWALRREDLPRRLRERCDAVEARAAWPGSLRMLLYALVPWWSVRKQSFAVPFRTVGRCLANVVAALYAAALPPADEGA